MKRMWSVRLARKEDASVIEMLIRISAHVLQSSHYSEVQVDGAIGSVFGVDHQLLSDHTCFLAEHKGQILGCGSWSRRKTLYGSDHWTGREDALLDPLRDAAKIRAFFIHPNWARRGVGSMILQACEEAAKSAGFARFEMGATLTGAKLFGAKGYVAVKPITIPLVNGESLPVIHMEKPG